MNDNKVLYEIKSLEKMLVRELINNSDIKDKENLLPTPTQCQIIEYILNNKNKDIYQKDLEKVLNLRRATVSGVLHTMEKNGLIKRVTDESDTRTKKIILNEKIPERFNEYSKKIKKIENNIIKDISDKDLEIFLKVISQMKESIKKKEGNLKYD
ncbi:MAG: MarR family transcriptional regulator [Bacilli bacterium]|nr:MarR family transcriptional regulator [Mycoplasmatota bacterium]MDD6264133.1 MarR family transcriptional regulator [bacterium]MDY5992610.1 MarR family transcriptional regulator [Bacilli bacterium]MEE0014850.1 MarR family transcriptional regulator [Bacilli bacterium]